MNLTKVTITGADDSTDLKQLTDLSAEFPFVEWGILVSAKQEGRYRFPSRGWIEQFTEVAGLTGLQSSTHICGRWVREMFVGALNLADLPPVAHISQRIQINTHAEVHASTTGLFKSLEELRAIAEHQFIFQWDGVNDHLTYAAHGAGFNAAALFDTSGGAGQLPGEWPWHKSIFPCGYAGGLSPDNIEEQVWKIEVVCKELDYWIDMERRVRTSDDSALDMTSVRRVLEICKPLIKL